MVKNGSFKNAVTELSKKIVTSSEKYSGEKVLIFKMEMVRNTVVISNNFRSYHLMKESMVHNCTSRREVLRQFQEVSSF